MRTIVRLARAGWMCLWLSYCWTGSAQVPGSRNLALDETGIRAVLREGKTVVQLPVTLNGERPVAANLHLAWLNTRDSPLRDLDQEITILPGASVIEQPLELPLSDIFLRLRYRLSPQDPRAFSEHRGIVAISQIAPHAFELKIGHTEGARPGERFTVHAQAIQAGSRAPMQGVQWSATLRMGGEEHPAIAIRPLAAGYAEIEFDVPKVDDDELKVEVQGGVGDFLIAGSTEVRLFAQHMARVQTDKALYQPGQVLHTRLVLQDRLGHTVANEKVSLTIADTRGEVVHRADLITSKFGVASEDWTIPDLAELGNYRIRVEETESGDDVGNHAVKVSRYELPTFRVVTELNRPIYLPGQDVSVTVRADYLYGKRATTGRVKVTRFQEPKWNQKTRSYETAEDVVAEGPAGSDGSLVAQLDVNADQRKLAEDDRDRFRDLEFAAYFTDGATGRTEQKKFDVRISREPIHVYLSVMDSAGPLPAPLFVSAYYADGRPAEVSVEVAVDGMQAAGRTNRFGVGKVILPHGFRRGSVEARVRAQDAAGLTGTWQERAYLRGQEGLRLESARSLYSTGESVGLRVSGAGEDSNRAVMVYALGEQSELLASRLVQLSNGSGDVEFPYSRQFAGVVTFVAWDGNRAESGYGERLVAMRSVLFPVESDLRLKITPEKATYRPGQKAALRVSVQTAQGAPVQSALGLAIVDEAVLERVRTDRDFDSQSWFRCRYCRSDEDSEIGGVSWASLRAMDRSKPVPAGLDAVAEMFLARRAAAVSVSGEDNLRTDLAHAFRDTFVQQEREVKAALDALYLRDGAYPRNELQLSAEIGTVWNRLKDPWERPYRAEFRFEGDDEVLDIVSSGPDKLAGTADDFSIGTVTRSYFLPIRRVIEPVLESWSEFPTAPAEVIVGLRERGIDFEKLLDPWGTPYRVSVSTERAERRIQFLTAGPDRAFDTGDETIVASFRGRYFERDISAIQKQLRNTQSSPQTLEDFENLLKRAGVDLNVLRDAWGHPYRVVRSQASRYGDARSESTIRVYQGSTRIQTNVTPVTRTFITFSIESVGRDGLPETLDDFPVAQFTTLVREESSTGTAPTAPAVARGLGAIEGTLLDQAGAVIPDQAVALASMEGGGRAEVKAGVDGRFTFADLAPGAYSISIHVPGFRSLQIIQIPVFDGQVTLVDAVLEVGSVSESVTVSEEALLLRTESASVTSVGAISTPRVREYFPETLLWIPELITDARGSARTTFKMADTVTNWKVAVFASTEDGRTVEGTADVRAFQPFFLDFQPPPVLTEGDELQVPVTVRNYQSKAETVRLTYGAQSQEVKVDAEGFTNAKVSMRAPQPAASVKHRVVARGKRTSDSIEKSVRVHPDGQEQMQIVSDFVSGPISFGIPVPQSAIPGATQAEVRLYPGTLSLLTEGAKAVMLTPHGCAEQTVSAGWANVIALKYADSVGLQDAGYRTEAIKNIEIARFTLRAFEDGSGGVRYWPQSETADVAVTAHALQFLIEASMFVEAENSDLVRIVRWLEQRQGRDGRWSVGTQKVEAPSMLLTAVVTRALAAAKRGGIAVNAAVLNAAYRAMENWTDTYAEPYAMAQFTLAAIDSGRAELVRDLPGRLVSLMQRERGAAFWDMRTNTPFYGWGTAGRVETTGLVVDALAEWRRANPERTDLDATIRSGLVFLLRSRDQLGSWYSTQGTLRAMHAVNASVPILGDLSGKGGRVNVRVNGRVVKTVTFANSARAVDPIAVDLSSFLSALDNRVEIVPSAGAQAAIVHTVAKYWLPWDQTSVRQHSELRLTVQYDRTNASVDDIFLCRVKAERVGFRGYGMMLADIGLPPGMEVDRSTFEKALNVAAVDHFDVLPDRVVIYLWPRAGGVEFEFGLRARMPMIAKTGASTLYDYYNPEALAEVTPVRFSVK